MNGGFAGCGVVKAGTAQDTRPATLAACSNICTCRLRPASSPEDRFR
jgi:hypothetical protein